MNFPRKNLLAIMLAGFFGQSAFAGKNVCTITINSSNEKEVFKSVLKPQGFKFFELTEPDSYISDPTNKGDWFSRACQSKIQCDVLVISGHFAGSFFGKSGLGLSLNELERRSCDQRCPGILNQPKEVFLFGCNTLANKERDHRTIDQYIDVLVTDGFSRREAEQIADGRYGSFGQENGDRMKRAFMNVPYLYGFSSTSPLGERMEPMIRNYLRAIPDYASHLNAITASGKNADSAPNSVIARFIKNPKNGIESFKQTSGLSPTDSAYSQHQNVCKMFDASTPFNQRFDVVDELMRSEKSLTYLPSVIEFVRFNFARFKNFERQLLERAKSNLLIRDKVLSGLEKIRTPLIKLEWATFAYNLEWITASELASSIENLYRSLLTFPIPPANADTACSVVKPSSVTLQLGNISQGLTRSHLMSPTAIKILSCSGAIGAPALQALLLTELNSGNANLLLPLLDHPAMESDTPNGRQLFERAKSLCVGGSQNLGCLRALSRLPYVDSEAANWAKKVLPSLTGENATFAMKILATNSALSASQLSEDEIRHAISSVGNKSLSVWSQTYVYQFLATQHSLSPDAVKSTLGKPTVITADKNLFDGYYALISRRDVGSLLKADPKVHENVCRTVQLFSKNYLRFVYPERSSVSCPLLD